MKGFKLIKFTENFKFFESNRSVTYDLDEFLRLCETQLKRGYIFIGEYQSGYLFRLTPYITNRNGGGK